tara:strand:+ start:1502 stop:1999 length:498 start_codon:yes stop_codon:yes gene_type:complete
MVLKNKRERPYLKSRGYSFVELLVVSAILLILASAIAPLSSITMQRQRESELRRSLRELRTAIDDYKDAVDLGLIAGTDIDPSNAGYPPNLDVLVEGVETTDEDNGGRLRFLRRIPIDPMTKTMEWGLRSYQDDPDSTLWGGDNIYDVYTTSRGAALDGTFYREW